jgi:hypothetical protein
MDALAIAETEPPTSTDCAWVGRPDQGQDAALTGY